MNWIDLKQQEPPFLKRVLFYEEVKPEWKENNYGIVIGYLNTKHSDSSGVRFEILNDKDHQEVDATHWMPLPEPPLVSPPPKA